MHFRKSKIIGNEILLDYIILVHNYMNVESIFELFLKLTYFQLGNYDIGILFTFQILLWPIKLMISKILRSRQGSNLRGETPLDFKSNALTTRPRLLVVWHTSYDDNSIKNCIIQYFFKNKVILCQIRIVNNSMSNKTR